MRLRYRLMLLLLLAAFLPLLLLGVTATQVSTRSGKEANHSLQLQKASSISQQTTSWLQERLTGLSSVSKMRSAGESGPLEEVLLLRLLLAQDEALRAVAFMDLEGELSSQALLLHPAGVQDSERRLEELISRSPYAAALDGGVALGEAYQPQDHQELHLPVTIQTGERLLTVELSLEPLHLWLQQQVEEGQALVLMDAENQLLAGTPGSLISAGDFQSFQGNLQGSVHTRLPSGSTVVASFDSVADTGWTVVVAQPSGLVGRDVAEIRTKTLYLMLVALLLSIILGLLGTQQLLRPILALRESALAVAQGDLGRRLPMQRGALELQEMTRAFNFMSTSLDRNQQALEQKNIEIQAFNKSLQERVELRTRELREAQQQLVESSRMAAVAHMGAGMAHELNNPLTGILGMAQLLKLKLQDEQHAAMLGSIEEQAQRCRDILMILGKLAETGGQREPLSLLDAFHEALELTRVRLEERGVTLQLETEEAISLVADARRLPTALGQLLLSLAASLRPGDGIRVLSASPQQGLSFILSGEGDRADDWMAAGMNLWVARQILAQEGLSLQELEEGERYQLTVTSARG